MRFSLLKNSQWILCRESNCLQHKTFQLREGRNMIGRNDTGTDITLLSKYASRRHCEIIVDGNLVKVIDLKVI